MPLVIRLALGSLLVVVGIALLVIAVFAARRRLPRNRFAGVRTAATLRSNDAFTQGNRAAAPLLAAAGIVGVLAGGVVLAGGPAATEWTILAVGSLGMVTLAGIGGVVGDRVAATVRAPSGCAGSCVGCDRAATCRDTADAQAAATPGSETTS